MLTLKYIKKVMKNKTISANEGSCFGVTDPSRLRETCYLSTEHIKYNNGYEEGKRSVLTDFHGFDSFQIYMVDKELCHGLKARVMYNSIGSKEGVDEWVKDKIPFSDIKSKKLQYIVQSFE